MAKMKVPCPNCSGTGMLPPLGKEGNPLDVKRFFPRPCDACNCSRFVNKNVEIKGSAKDEAQIAESAEWPCG